MERVQKLHEHLLMPRSSSLSREETSTLSSDDDDEWIGLSKKRLRVMTSAKHVHLSVKDMVKLFGEGHEMKAVAFLAGLPEEIALKAGFASSDKVTLVGPRMGRQLAGVRVLGPCRGETQVELARTDAVHFLTIFNFIFIRLL